MQDDEQNFERLLSVLTRLCEAIEDQNELTVMSLSLSGDEEESGPSEPQPL